MVKKGDTFQSYSEEFKLKAEMKGSYPVTWLAEIAEVRGATLRLL